MKIFALLPSTEIFFPVQYSHHENLDYTTNYKRNTRRQCQYIVPLRLYVFKILCYTMSQVYYIFHGFPVVARLLLFFFLMHSLSIGT